MPAVEKSSGTRGGVYPLLVARFTYLIYTKMKLLEIQYPKQGIILMVPSLAFY
jgi:hypothetical protein